MVGNPIHPHSNSGTSTDSDSLILPEPAARCGRQMQHQVVRGVVGSLKVITRQESLRLAEYAFHYAKTNGRERVSAIHKANITRKTDRLFLKYCCAVAEKYPEITYVCVLPLPQRRQRLRLGGPHQDGRFGTGKHS